jgi:hypothetical protein
MIVQRIPITSREQWLDLRKGDVTASTIGALRGLHPYTSRLRLYKEKTGFDFKVEENVRMRRGSLLEAAVAARVGQERPEWQIVPAGEYLRDPSLRLGGTPDFYIHGDPRGVGILQTKLSIAGVFEKAWRDEDGVIAPPMWIRLQALTEAMLHDAAFGAIAVYIDHPFRDDVHIFEFDRHAGAEAAIRNDVAQFWQDVEWQIEPDASGSVDASLVKLMYPESDPLIHIDLTGDNYLTSALAERARLKTEIAEAEASISEIETELKAKMGAAELAHFHGFMVTHKTVDRKGFEVKPTRYRKLNVTDLRPKEIIDAEQARF